MFHTLQVFEELKSTICKPPLHKPLAAEVFTFAPPPPPTQYTTQTEGNVSRVKLKGSPLSATEGLLL